MLLSRSWSYKNIDVLFLGFLLLVTQGSIPLKIIAVFFIFLMRPKALLTIKGFGKFYIFMLFFHILYGLLALFTDDWDYLTTYIIVAFLWLLAFVTVSQLYFFIKQNTLSSVKRTINAFFLVCVLVVVLQFIVSMVVYGTINPYGASPAAGDRMSSIFSNSSVNTIVMSFFLLNYIFLRNWSYALMALLSLLAGTYMSGTVIFIVAIMVSMFFFAKTKMIYKLYMLVAVTFFSVLFVIASPENLKYAMGYINRIIEFNDADIPFKIKSFGQTLNYWVGSMRTFILGSGGGNFSSRAAFIVSGDYVSWFPRNMIYVSEGFKNNHFDIWTYDFNNPWDNRNNTANQPFSFYNKIIGEYGLLGIVAFTIYYLKYFISKWRLLSFSKFMIIALGGYFVLDYWFEYFSVLVLFELLFLSDLKMGTKQRGTYTEH